MLADAARGDKAAMRQLYERHHDALFAFLRMRCDDDATTMDAVQDTMLEVWRSAGKFSGKSSVRTWIFAIGRNKLIDRVRRVSQLSFVEEVPEEIDDTPDAETVITASQNATLLRACLDKLKKAQLAVIRLAFYDELPYGEIAEIEGVPVGTVKTRIFHAKQALMHCLGRSA
ncbi:RNA polymerase sigma factor [Pseudooceanicola nanhaiensis]|uniref:RNA polymerase sigma factor n=1 Tax=Pseudooceanicola nanhaiensis TaxID=375761 RepID=UPI001CD72736|nr:sigma-70 family RNA polymerase sigma factor [Pseudooceanicola nanhaiensis]MCA0920668.1 sigma-70 family RNA polymerase sigma factor [Pseudooceanicola nanhaiensis]